MFNILVNMAKEKQHVYMHTTLTAVLYLLDLLYFQLKIRIQVFPFFLHVQS